ncbi:hypothetical protein MRX96_019079 [Rhipicephalus microplus]
MAKPAGCLATFHSHLPGQQPTTLGVSAPPPLSLSLFRGLRRAPAPCLRGARACPHRRRRHQATTKSNCHRRPSARGAAAGTCIETRRRTGGFGQPQSSNLWCPPAHPAETATDPAQAFERQREHDHAFGSGDHPVPVSPGGPAQGHTTARACTGAAACDHGARGAAMGLNTGSPLLVREPRGSAAGHVSGWTCAGHFPAEPVHSGPGPQPDSDTRRIGADPELSGTDTGGPAGPAGHPMPRADPVGTSNLDRQAV